MAVLFDTAPLEAADRVEAFRTAMMEASGSTRIELDETSESVRGRMALWSFGTARVFTAASTGISMSRDSRAARGASTEAVAVAVQGAGTGHHVTRAGQRNVRTGDLMVVDITRPFEFSWTGRGSSTSIQVPIVDLGLPVDSVQQAADRLEASPLYGMVSRHLVELTRHADSLSRSPMAVALGESTAHLVRALLAGSADPDSRTPEVVEETLISQVRVHVHQHLHDPALGPDTVASSLAVSRRQLFRACQQAGFSLEQYVIERRLVGAKADLATPGGRARTIAASASRWGFKDPTHFSRRFKAAFGMLPRDWRRIAAEQAG